MGLDHTCQPNEGETIIDIRLAMKGRVAKISGQSNITNRTNDQKKKDERVEWVYVKFIKSLVMYRIIQQLTARQAYKKSFILTYLYVIFSVAYIFFYWIVQRLALAVTLVTLLQVSKDQECRSSLQLQSLWLHCYGAWP